MTIKEAQEKWGVKDGLMFRYLRDGFLNHISVENNEIIIPDISKPIRVSPTAKKTTLNIYKYIIKACKYSNYVDSFLLRGIGETPGNFKTHINLLVEKNILRHTEEYVDDTSNIGFTLTPDGEKIARECLSNPQKLENALKILGIVISAVGATTSLLL